MCGWKDRCRDGNLRTYCHVSPIWLLWLLPMQLILCSNLSLGAHPFNKLEPDNEKVVKFHYIIINVINSRHAYFLS